jgi:cleavage and polyadenylation specificity factor subunit 2
MFPHFEEAIMFDEYGEVMDTSVYQKQQDEVLGFTDETINFSGLDTRTVAPQGEREGAVVPAQPREEVPTKSVAYTVRVQMQAAVSFVDFGGRSDGRSAHTILEHLKPGKVIIVHGTEAATESLRDFCVAKVTEPESTMAPAVGDAVLASSDTNIYRIKLDSDLAQSLAFVRVGGYDVAYIDAVMQMPAQPTQPAAAQAAQVPTLVQRPGDAGRGRPFAFIGDVKLSDLKTLLSKEGYRTELKAGMLVVNGQVVIRKSGARMVFEGTICNEYAAVRNILLSQYHTL